MKKSLICLAVSIGLSLPADAGNLYLGADVSTSNPAVASQEFADAVSERVSEEILNLKSGDKIVLKTFGNDKTHHVKPKTLQISRKERVESAANKVADEIRSFPRQKIKEGATNILAYLENSHFDCSKDGSQIWLLTDGIENSVDFSGKDLFEGKPLPEPFEQNLEGCAVTMIGVGRLADGGRLSRKQIHTIRKIWVEWLKKAGASTVTILVDPQ